MKMFLRGNIIKVQLFPLLQISEKENVMIKTLKFTCKVNISGKIYKR